MPKLIVKETIPGSDLGAVELEYQTISVSKEEDGRPEETHELRIFVPPDVEGEPFVDWVFGRLSTFLEQTSDEEQDFYRWVLNMVGFHNICPDIDRQRRRRFDIRTLATSATFCELASMTRMTGTSKGARLIRFAGLTAAATTRLLQEAIYVEPDLQVPIAGKHYIEFREQILSEMCWVSEKVDDLGRKALQDMREKVTSDGQLSAKKRNKALAKLKAMEEGNDAPELVDGWKRAMQLVMKKALEMENEGAAEFSGLVEKARGLQEAVAKEVEARRMEMLAEDGEALSEAYADCIVKNFDVTAADALLDEAIDCYRRVHEIPPAELVDVSEWPLATEDLAVSEAGQDEVAPFPAAGASAEDENSDLPVAWQQYAGFVFARNSDDVFQKWYMVGWITTNLINRNECIRLLKREAEGVYHGVLDYGFKLVYRKIRHRLTYTERRIFKLMYFRQPMFGFHVAAMNPVILSFFTGMDDETQLLLLLVLVLKRKESGGEKGLDRELERRWRAYLRFYPYWLEIIRSEDRVAKQQRAIKSKTLSLESPIGLDENGKEFTGRDILADHRNKPVDLLQALVVSSQGRLAEWATKYCTVIQARHVTRFAAGTSETKIAEDEGISQPAVSKSIRAAMNRIKKGLVRDGVLKSDADQLSASAEDGVSVAAESSKT